MATKFVTIFEHNGTVGAESDIENGSFINDVEDPNQLGIIFKPEHARITTKALDLIKSSRKSDSGFAAIMLTNEEVGKHGASIGFIGFYKHILSDSGRADISRDSDLSVLDLIEIDDTIEAPEDFVKFVDSK